MRSTKQERKRNARVFYQSLMSGVYDRAAIVAVRNESSNPNIQRCQFFAVIGLGMSKPVVIAESVWGIDGCFIYDRETGNIGMVFVKKCEILSGYGIDSVLNLTDTIMDLCRDFL